MPEAYRWILSLPGLLLAIAACLGFCFALTVFMNVAFSYPVPKRLLKTIRKSGILIIVLSPLMFAALIGFGVVHSDGLEGKIVRPLVFLCFVLGALVAPICQLAYWLRRTAPQQVGCTSEIVDVEGELGYLPAGHGKHDFSRLPGNQIFQVEFNEKTLALPQLPRAWDGLTILHLTDLHLCGTPDRRFFEWVVEHAMKPGVPDLVAITGDIVDSDWHHRWIVPVLGRLRWKDAGLAILGNHDAWRDPPLLRRRLRRLGLHYLGNGWEQLTIRDQPMIVVGHEGPWFGPPPDLSACPIGTFRLCLSHTPDHIRWAQRSKIDLMLAGHVHGGQIRFPLIGSTFVPSWYSRQYDCGMFYRAPTVMHVCRGLAGQHPLRFRCRPEVTRLVLRKA